MSTNIDSNDQDEFGAAQIDAEFDGYKLFKLRSPDPKKGETMTEFVCRLLPPMKSYKATGKWSFFYGNHFGHYGVNNRNPDRPRARPFGCVQEKNNRTGEITKHCPKCDQLEAARGRIKTREEDLKRANPGFDEQGLKELYRNDSKLRSDKEWLSSNNCDKKFWMNVMALDGSFGVLQLSYKTFNNKLKPALREWAEKKRIDAFDLNKGVWIRFTRTGQKLNVEDSVGLHMETVDLGNGETAEKHRAAPLNADQRARASKVCPDLALNAVKVLTAEQILALINCSGEPGAVDEIWDGPKKTEAGTSSSDDGVDDGNDELLNNEQAAPPPAQLSAEDEEAALMERMKAVQERKAREKAAAVVVETSKTSAAVVAAASKSSGDPSEDFLSKFQPKQ